MPATELRSLEPIGWPRRDGSLRTYGVGLPAGNVPTGSDSWNFYVYDASFYLPDSLAGCSNLQIGGSMMADNQAGVFLNGNYIASQPGAPNSWDGENPTGTNTNTPFPFTSPVPIGDFNVSAANTIDFVVWDATYAQTGLDYTVTVSESGCPISSGPLGSSFDDSATVTGDATGGSPAGTVSFSVCGPLPAPAPSSPCTATDYQVGTATLTSGASDSATADSASFTPTAAGYWCFDGTYSGDSSYLGSSDASTDECIDVTPTCVTGPGADLANCNVSGSNLNNANLDGADLSYANITGALLNSTNLTGANLTGANLYGASGGMDDFMGANLTDAYTYGATYPARTSTTPTSPAPASSIPSSATPTSPTRTSPAPTSLAPASPAPLSPARHGAIRPAPTVRTATTTETPA